jgi:hypothetical protein
MNAVHFAKRLVVRRIFTTQPVPSATDLRLGTSWIQKTKYAAKAMSKSGCCLIGIVARRFMVGGAMIVLTVQIIRKKKNRRKLIWKKRMWKPIGTAPKDGTIILSCGTYADRNDLGEHPRAVVWKIYHPNAPGKGTWRNHLGHKENFLTHWMPLPVAPEEDK